jgi:hypothetical protein
MKRAFTREGADTFRLNTETRQTIRVRKDGLVNIGGLCYVSLEDFFAIGKVSAALAKEQRG